MASQIKVKQVNGLQSTLDALIGIDKISETFTTTATDGDTAILITQSARESDAIQVFVNGQKLQEGYSWKKGGSAITASSLEANTELVWSSAVAGFDLDSSDEIQIEYETLTSGNASLSGGGSGISGAVTGHLIPDAHETYDLGRADKKFRDLYLSDSTIHMGDKSFSSTNIDDSMEIKNISVPVSQTSEGNKGDVVFDDTYMYICVNTNSWKRINLDTTW